MIQSVQIEPGCISCKTCEGICPEVFQVTGSSHVISDKFNKHAIKVLQAAAACPVSVIKVKSDTPLGNIGKQRAIVLNKKYLSNDILELTLEHKLIGFQPGQYISLQMKDLKGDFSRSYSIARSDKTNFTLTIKLVGNGRGSNFLKKLKKKNILQINKKLDFLGPFGNFVLQNNPKRKVFIATGTGLAPLISMIDSLGDDIKKVLIFGGRKASDFYYLDILKQYKNLEIIICLSQEKRKNMKQGRVTDFLDTIQTNDEVYICGNPQMIDDVIANLESRGVQSNNIHYEKYTQHKPNNKIKDIFLSGNIPYIKLLSDIIIYSSVIGIPISYYFSLGSIDYYLLAWYAVCFVMYIRPLSNIFSNIGFLRGLIPLRRAFGILSSIIIVTILLVKWIQSPSSLIDYASLSNWTGFYTLLSRISEITALILLVTSNSLSQQYLGNYWKKIQTTSYLYFISGGLIAGQYGNEVLYYGGLILWGILYTIAYVKNRAF